MVCRTCEVRGETQPCEPRIHEISILLARRSAAAISSLIPPGMLADTEDTLYRTIRRTLEVTPREEQQAMPAFRGPW